MFMHHELVSCLRLRCSPETQHDLSPAIHHCFSIHSNDKAPVSTCHTDQLHFSAQETKNVEEEEEGHFWARLGSKFQPFKPLLFL